MCELISRYHKWCYNTNWWCSKAYRVGSEPEIIREDPEKVLSLKNKIKHGFVHKYLDDESKEKYEHLLEKREESAESLKKSMISHLSALNDGVIAIFITVMMLEIPYPRLQTEFKGFLWSIAVFLVSFFIVAAFWYDNKYILLP